MPLYDFKDFRITLNDHFAKRVASDEAGNKKDGIERYWAYKNSESMDGLPGMRRGVDTAKREEVEPIKKLVGAVALTESRKYSHRLKSTSPMTVALLSFLSGMVVATFLIVFAQGDQGSLSDELRGLMREIRGSI